MTARYARRASGGFSVVELMVSIVIGMLALLFATRMTITSENARQASLGGSDSMQNGMQALASIAREAGQAGWGLNDPLIAGCDTVFSDTSGFVLPTALRGTATVSPLASAIITQGAVNGSGTDPDQLTLMSGSSMSGTGTLRLTNDYSSGTSIAVDRVPYGFARNDVIVVVPETVGSSKCALAQISADPSSQAAPPNVQTLTIASGTGWRYNSGSLGVAFKNGLARLFNLGPAGTLSFHTWSVNKGFLQLRATDLTGTSSTAKTVIDNVVTLKAQYGFDTRTGAAFTPQSGMRVNVWSGAMIDADGDGTIGGAGDYQHVSALRVAVVARSRNPEKPNATTGLCSATTVLPQVFATAEPTGVAAVPLSVNVAVTGAGIDWKCYRYRVFESIIPIRNAGWSPT